jgi:Ni,Fe-hydrogenase III component G
VLIADLGLDVERLPVALPMWRASVRAETWRAVAQTLSTAGGRLLSLWGSDRRRGAAGGLVVSAAYVLADGLLWLDLPLGERNPGYPDLAPFFPCAARMQRATADLLGVSAEGAADRRGWLDHGAWPVQGFPLRREGGAATPLPEDPLGTSEYAFVRVEGDGVHEIPVGPVHAGIIEPGHFRFSVVGEKVLRLEQRLGYKHKGVEKRFTELPPLAGASPGRADFGRFDGGLRLGLSAWRWSRLAGCEISARAGWLRALLLERERVANHLGDLGALGNDAAFAFGLAQFSRLREDWLRLSQRGLRPSLDDGLRVARRRRGGHRRRAARPPASPVRRDRARSAGTAPGVRRACRPAGPLHDHRPGDAGTGRSNSALPAWPAAPAAQAADLRCDQPWPPYDRLGCDRHAREGDVAARVGGALRRGLRIAAPAAPAAAAGAGEVQPSPALRLPASRPRLAPAGSKAGAARSSSRSNGTASRRQRIRRCHVHDPSWQNWPVLEHAVIGNIVPDFPLINKSFNLSYSGHDL